MNVGQITDRNLNVRQLRNRAIPFTPPISPPLLETLIQVSPKGHALIGIVLHRNLSYRVKTMTQQKGLDQHL